MFTLLRPRKEDPFARPRSFLRLPQRHFGPPTLTLGIGPVIVSNQHYVVDDLFLRPNLRLRWLAAENYVLVRLRSGMLPLTIVSHSTLIDHDLLFSQSIARVIDNMRREGRFDGLPTPEEYALLTGQDRARVISRLGDRFLDEQDITRYSRDKEIDEKLGMSFSDCKFPDNLLLTLSIARSEHLIREQERQLQDVRSQGWIGAEDYKSSTSISKIPILL
jgi:hypothetical protein